MLRYFLLFFDKSIRLCCLVTTRVPIAFGLRANMSATWCGASTPINSHNYPQLTHKGGVDCLPKLDRLAFEAILDPKLNYPISPLCGTSVYLMVNISGSRRRGRRRRSSKLKVNNCPMINKRNLRQLTLMRSLGAIWHDKRAVRVESTFLIGHAPRPVTLVVFLAALIP